MQNEKVIYKKLFEIKDDSKLEEEIEAWVQDTSHVSLKEVLLQALGYNNHLVAKIPNMILSNQFNTSGRTFVYPYAYNKEEIILQNVNGDFTKQVTLIVSRDEEVNYRQALDDIVALSMRDENFDHLPISVKIRYQEAKNILFYINFLKPLTFTCKEPQKEEEDMPEAVKTLI